MSMDDPVKPKNGFAAFLASWKAAISLVALGILIGGWMFKREIDEANRLITWIICTSVPENRADVREALGIQCPPRDRINPQFEDLEEIPAVRPASPIAPMPDQIGIEVGPIE